MDECDKLTSQQTISTNPCFHVQGTRRKRVKMLLSTRHCYCPLLNAILQLAAAQSQCNAVLKREEEKMVWRCDTPVSMSH